MPSVHEHRAEAIAILQQRFPEVALAVQTAPPVSTVASVGTPETTLICGGVHLTSCVNRRAEAELQAAEVPLDAPSVTVYGLALGDLPRVLLEREKLRELTVVLLNPGLFPAQNRCSPMSWLAEPRLRLSLGRWQTRVAFPFAVAPACLRLAEDQALRIRDLVQQELTHRFQQQGLTGLVARLGTGPEIAERLRLDQDVRHLYASYTKSRAVVVAGGPSLERALPYLQEVRSEVRLIAVTTALRVLLRAGLVPDFAVAVDPRLEIAAHFENLDLQRLQATPLVYLAGVHPRVLDRWMGPRVAAFRAGSRDPEDYPAAPKGELFCSGTVTHAAVDLGLRLGASEIVLVGADFCFPADKPHAGEAPLQRGLTGSGPTAMNGHGEHVPSSLALLGYLRELEGYVAKHDQVRFLKWGREGAELAGATWLD